jgi:hypothetical protein
MSEWAIWGAFGAAFLATVVAVVLFAVTIRRGLRSLGDTRRNAVQTLAELGAKGELTAEKAAQAADTAELQESLARLRVSLARLAVLRAALDEAGAVFERLTAFVPRA